MFISNGIVQWIANFVICVCLFYIIRTTPAHDTVKYYSLLVTLLIASAVAGYKVADYIRKK